MADKHGLEDSDFELLLWRILSHAAGRRLPSREEDLWIHYPPVKEILGSKLFAEYFIAVAPSFRGKYVDPTQVDLPWNKGGGRNGSHKNPHAKLSAPERLKELEEKLRKAMQEPPKQGRQAAIDKIKREIKHIRTNANDPGEEHSKQAKGYRNPTTREISEDEQ